MCYHHEEEWSEDENRGTQSRRRRIAIANAARSAALVENLRGRLAETEARLARARAREAELSRQLHEMKRFVSVMEILEAYLNRRFAEQRDLVSRLLSSPVP
uniref:Protein SKIP34 n=1 Tax=Opuntia streptacantha TaxID=393608 RepID=A0A7C8ZSF3_OPUST